MTDVCMSLCFSSVTTEELKQHLDSGNIAIFLVDWSRLDCRRCNRRVNALYVTSLTPTIIGALFLQNECLRDIDKRVYGIDNGYIFLVSIIRSKMMTACLHKYLLFRHILIFAFSFEIKQF